MSKGKMFQFFISQEVFDSLNLYPCGIGIVCICGFHTDISFAVILVHQKYEKKVK